MKKSTLLLTIGVAILFLILTGEIYYLFFMIEPQTMKQSSKISVLPKDNFNLYQKRSDKTVSNYLNYFTSMMDTFKPTIKSGVAKEFILTQTFKTTITKIGLMSPVEKTYPDGIKVTYVYTTFFATMSETGKKEFGYIFTEGQIDRINAFQIEGENEVPIDLNTLKEGDFVSVTVVTNMFGGPDDDLISMKIVKLL